MTILQSDPEIWQRRQHPDGSPSRWRETNGITWAERLTDTRGCHGTGCNQGRTPDGCDCQPEAAHAANEFGDTVPTAPAPLYTPREPKEPAGSAAVFVYGISAILTVCALLWGAGRMGWLS